MFVRHDNQRRGSTEPHRSFGTRFLAMVIRSLRLCTIGRVDRDAEPFAWDRPDLKGVQ